MEQQYQDLVTLYQSRGKERQAIQAYRVFVSDNPGHVQAWKDLGALLHQAEDVIEALHCYHQLTKLSPEDTEAWQLKAMVLSDLNRSQNPAFSQLQHLKDVYKQRYRSIKDLRKDLLKCYDNILQSARNDNSSDLRSAKRNKARILEQIGKHKEALELYQWLFDTETSDGQRHSYQLAIARQFEAVGKLNLALEILDEMIACGDFHLLIDKARILKKCRKRKEAEETAHRFFVLVGEKYDSTKDVSYIFQKASAYEAFEKPDEAIQCLEQLLNSGIKMSLRQTADAKDRIERIKRHML